MFTVCSQGPWPQGRKCWKMQPGEQPDEGAIIFFCNIEDKRLKPGDKRRNEGCWRGPSKKGLNKKNIYIYMYSKASEGTPGRYRCPMGPLVRGYITFRIAEPVCFDVELHNTPNCRWCVSLPLAIIARCMIGCHGMGCNSVRNKALHPRVPRSWDST